MGICLSRDLNLDFNDEKINKLRTEMVHQYLKNKSDFKARQIKDDTMETSNEASYIASLYTTPRRSARKSVKNQDLNQNSRLSLKNTLPKKTRHRAVLPPSEVINGLEPIILKDSQEVILNQMRPKPAESINKIFIDPVHPDIRTTQSIMIQTAKIDQTFKIEKQLPLFSKIIEAKPLLHDESVIPDSKRPQFISSMEKNIENIDLLHKRTHFLDISINAPDQTVDSGSIQTHTAQEHTHTLNCLHEAEVPKPYLTSLLENQDLMIERKKFLDMSESIPEQLHISYAKMLENRENVYIVDDCGKLVDISVYAAEETEEPDSKKPQFLTLNQKKSLNTKLLGQRIKFLDKCISVPEQPQIPSQLSIIKDPTDKIHQLLNITEFQQSEIPHQYNIIKDSTQYKPEHPKTLAQEISIKDLNYAENSFNSSDSFSHSSSQQEQLSIDHTFNSPSSELEEHYIKRSNSFQNIEYIEEFDQYKSYYINIQRDTIKGTSIADSLNLANEFTCCESYRDEDYSLSIQTPSNSSRQYALSLSPSAFHSSPHLLRNHERPISRDLVRLDRIGKFTIEQEIRFSQGSRFSLQYIHN